MVTSFLARYHPSLIAALVVVAIGVWPMLIAPLGRVYIAACARYLTDAPFGHHYPPYVVAFLAPLIVLLVAGFVVVLARQLWRQRQLDTIVALRRDDANERCRRIVHDLGLTGRVVLTSDQAAYAFCGGLVRPRIYVSRGLLSLLSAAELEAVLRHERHHLRHYDPLRYFLTEFLDRLEPLCPVLGTLTGRMRINAELAADRAALRHTSTEQLAGALVKVMRAGAPIAPPATVAGLSPTDARVAALLGQPISMPVDRRDVGVSIGFALTVAAVVIWLATQQLPLPPSCSNCPRF